MNRALLVISLALAMLVAGSLAAASSAYAGSHPATQANCIGTANSNGNGEFVSTLATTVPPGEFGATTAAILGGPHGLIGVVASSDSCG